jgi:hypothetical protein
VSFPRRLASTYARIGRTYWSWAGSILLLAVIIFVPLGLIDALVVEIDVESLDLGSGVKVAAIVATVGVITATGLLGEVFFSGAVAVSLTHPHHERPPSLTEIARRLRYGRLIAVDVVYVLIVAVGLLFAVVPGALAFVWLGLAGPAVELEQRTVRGALARSWRLVRGNFWLVFFVLVPIEVAGDAIGDGVAGLVHAGLGDTLIASWLAESLSNIVLSPLFAVAAVLLTIDLIAAKDGDGPRLNSVPAPTPAPA